MSDLPVWASGWEVVLRDGGSERASALVTGELPRYVRKKGAAGSVFDRMPPAVHCFGHFFEAVPWVREPDDEFWADDFPADPHFARLLGFLAPEHGADRWRQRLRELGDWFRHRAGEGSVSAGRSDHDRGRDARNKQIGSFWDEAARGPFGPFVHQAVAAYILASVYDFCGAWQSGLSGFQPARAERERRWPVYFGLGTRGVWSRWEDPSAEEEWPLRGATPRAGCWLNFKMAMRMTKESRVREVDPGLFRTAGDRPAGELRAISALFYYFANMTLEEDRAGNWAIDYKGQRYDGCTLGEPDAWITARQAADRRDYSAFVAWYDERKARLVGLTLEVSEKERRVALPLG